MKSVDLERKLEHGLVQVVFAPRARALMNDLADLRPLARILDVGCGSGIAVRVAKERFASITAAHGLDFSANAIAGTLRDDGQCLCGRPASEPPSPSEPPTVFYPGEGFYRIGGSGYYSNGIGAYCAISSWDQFVACTCTNNRPWSEIPEQPNRGNNEYQGVCLCGT